MRIIIETLQEASILEKRFRAIAYQLPVTVELTAVLPDGKILKKYQGGSHVAAQLASLNERISSLATKLGQ